ncbi:hypothetical protein DL766_000626 [Monosporascus sp. MC13-8B]|uniref:Chitin-binding type-2 domain-containing protein n=1 Tax=Monosporascus cannonballus TaxID=155416 RepID=A0ABY0GW90_9PEZI|nr:hypothetical protein DL762_008396 [Monosporascus cannonballus]RYO80167.1 hypothetical protein DL763_009013 [Monosporascus cannonballus]RYP38986.1 hypothetical protein DL766_000626 [Monosporascus sp. MC13-8B]
MAPQVLLAASFGMAVQALAFDGRPSEPTDSPVPSPVNPLPSRITTPPSVLELAKRQEALTVLVAPDNTCGYLDGRAGAPYTCMDRTATCAFYPSSGLGAVGCCIDDICNWSLTCLDYVQVYSSSLCDNGCLYDTYTVKCTPTAAPPSTGSNTGAIVGGVVGGVGGIALISLVSFFLIRRHNNKTPPQQPPQMMQQFGPQGSPPGHGSTYNPVHPSPQYPPQGAYPPGGYYHDPSKPGGFVNMAPAGDPDRQSSASPTLHGSQLGADNRASMQQHPTSPTSTVYSSSAQNQYGPPQQQGGYASGVPPTVHEAGSNVIGQPGYNDNHHGQFHELQS